MAPKKGKKTAKKPYERRRNTRQNARDHCDGNDGLAGRNVNLEENVTADDGHEAGGFPPIEREINLQNFNPVTDNGASNNNNTSNNDNVMLYQLFNSMLDKVIGQSGKPSKNEGFNLATAMSAFQGNKPTLDGQTSREFATSYVPNTSDGSSGYGRPAGDGGYGRGVYGVPADSVGHIDVVPEPIRNSIVQGNDVSLSLLLLPGDFFHSRSYQIDDKQYLMKALSDPRAHKDLTISEFIKAFDIYKNVMCEEFPCREKELERYRILIIELASRFPGKLFYDYHRAFSAKAAECLHRNIKIDWSVRDRDLFDLIFAGCRANACKICHTVLHATDFCPHARRGDRIQNKPFNFSPGSGAAGGSTQTQQNHDIRGRPKIMHNNVEVCNNFNDNRCNIATCTRAHVCLGCRGSHPSTSCTNPRNVASHNRTAQSQPRVPSAAAGNAPTHGSGQ